MKSLWSELTCVKFPVETYTYKWKRELSLVALKSKTFKLPYSSNFPAGLYCKIIAKYCNWSRENCLCGHMQYFQRNANTKGRNIGSLHRKRLLKIVFSFFFACRIWILLYSLCSLKQGAACLQTTLSPVSSSSIGGRAGYGWGVCKIAALMLRETKDTPLPYLQRKK